jgi:uncharacterized membrane protein
VDQYRVQSPDGREYGPVDLSGLLQWIREGRILPATLIRKNEAAAVVAASLPEMSGAFGPEQLPPPPVAATVALPAEFAVWDFIGRAWALVQPHWAPLGAMFLIFTLVGVVPYLGACLSLLLSGTLLVGINRAILGMFAGREPTVEMMFGGFDRFGDAFLLSLVSGLLVALGLMALIVPGIILAVLWAFSNLIVAETSLDFWAAMQRSVELTRGFRWQIFLLMLASIPILILGLLVFCIGVVVAEAVVFTAFALAYRFLQARQAQLATA